MKGGESLGDEESSKEEEEVVPALILTSGVRPLAPDVKSHLSYPHITKQMILPVLARPHQDFHSRECALGGLEGHQRCGSRCGHGRTRPRRGDCFVGVEQHPAIGVGENLLNETRVYRMP